MYIYETFEVNGVFILLRPLVITCLIVAFGLLFIVVVPKLKQRLLNGFAVIILSLVSIVVAAQTLFYDGVIVDELGLGGDAFMMYAFALIVILSLFSNILYFRRRDRQE